MLKEKLPAIQPSNVAMESLIYGDVIASTITSNKGILDVSITDFIQSRRILTELLNTEAFSIAIDKTVLPTFLTQKQKDLFIAFLDSQSPNLNFLDFDLEVLSNTHYSSVDLFAQHKTTLKYFLFAFTWFDMFSFTGEFYPGLTNSEANIESLDLNIARISIKKRVGIELSNMAVINFSPSQTAFSVTKCAVLDDVAVQAYLDSKEKPKVVLSGQSNNKADIFGGSNW